jgi:hypothetical protein
LAAASSPDVVDLHPQAAQRYAAQVADIREPVEEITIIPTPRGEPIGIELQCDLAAPLNVNKHGTPVMATMVAVARNHLDLQLAQLLSATLGSSTL